MEKMTGGRKESRSYLDYLKAWRAAGFPKKFNWSPQQGQILDNSAKRAKLLDRLNPERTAERQARGELAFKKKVNSLYYG